jgi:hypothetical protein
MPTMIDVKSDIDINDISATTGGSVFGDVRVTFADGLDKAAAFKALQAISSALIGDKTQLD